MCDSGSYVVCIYSQIRRNQGGRQDKKIGQASLQHQWIIPKNLSAWGIHSHSWVHLHKHGMVDLLLTSPNLQMCQSFRVLGTILFKISDQSVVSSLWIWVDHVGFWQATFTFEQNETWMIVKALLREPQYLAWFYLMAYCNQRLVTIHDDWTRRVEEKKTQWSYELHYIGNKVFPRIQARISCDWRRAIIELFE